MTQAVPSRLHPRLRRTASSVVGEWNRIGSQEQFYGKTLMSIPDADGDGFRPGVGTPDARFT